MPHNRYFCHACQQEFEPQDTQTLQCTHCGSDFVERVTELTFTREERQVRRQQQSASQEVTTTDSDENGDNEETMDEMLFGPQGIFNTLIPIVVNVDTGREREGINVDENRSNGENTSAPDSVEGVAQEHATRRESLGHNLVHNVIPRVLRRVLHRHNQPREEQQQVAASTTDQQAEEGRGGHSDSTRMSHFDFTIPSGRRARIAIFTRSGYKSHAFNHHHSRGWPAERTANTTGTSEGTATEEQPDGQQQPQSFAEMFHQLLQGQFGDYVTGERRFDDIITRLMEEAMAQYSLSFHASLLLYLGVLLGGLDHLR